MHITRFAVMRRTRLACDILWKVPLQVDILCLLTHTLNAKQHLLRIMYRGAIVGISPPIMHLYHSMYEATAERHRFEMERVVAALDGRF